MLFVDWIMVFATIVSILLLTYIVIVSRRSERYYDNMDAKLAIRQRNGYVCSSTVFAFIHYWCILMSILSTLIVLYIGCFEEVGEPNIQARMILYSALALFTNICPYVINFLKLSRKFRQAFVVIETALVQNDKYGKALAECEKVIAGGFED